MIERRYNQRIKLQAKNTKENNNRGGKILWRKPSNYDKVGK